MSNQTKTDSVSMVPSVINLADMVPPEEQAVDTVREAKKLSLFGVSETCLMEDLIPEDEKGVPCLDEDSTLSEAKKLGLFSPAASMSNIHSSLTDRLFAIIRADEKGQRYFEYCQQYEDGSFSPMMQVAQADLYLAASYDFLSQNISERKIRSRVENFLIRAHEDYLGKFTGEELLDVTKILRLLFMARKDLREDMSSMTEQSAEDFYKKIIEEAAYLINGQMARKSYYAFDNGDITYLAGKFNMKKMEFLQKLKKFNLLYLTKSSKGYQTCVKYTLKAEDTESGEDESYTEWRYCIFRFDNLKGAGSNK